MKTTLANEISTFLHDAVSSICCCFLKKSMSLFTMLMSCVLVLFEESISQLGVKSASSLTSVERLNHSYWISVVKPLNTRQPTDSALALLTCALFSHNTHMFV